MKSSTLRSGKTIPSVEVLENRLVLDNTSFVTNLYHDVLHRAPDVKSEFWVLKLIGGTSRREVATSFWESDEHRTLEVSQFYQTFLQRVPDGPGEAAFKSMLENGTTELQVEQFFLNSSEYRVLHSSAANFVESLYSEVLGRSPTTSEESTAVSEFNQEGSQRLVADLVNSLESYKDIVSNDYTTFMNRPADPGGQVFWANTLRNNGGNTEQVALAFLSADEYFALGAK